jgi:hypothetical protein
MTETGRKPNSGYDLDAMVQSALESEFGSAEALPAGVLRRLRAVYREFLPIYLEMIRLKEHRPAGWQPEMIAVDPAMVAELQHFFSDYQHIARRFQGVRRQVKTLMSIDRQTEARRFDQCARRIVSGAADPETSILSSLLER